MKIVFGFILRLAVINFGRRVDDVRLQPRRLAASRCLYVGLGHLFLMLFIKSSKMIIINTIKQFRKQS